MKRCNRASVAVSSVNGFRACMKCLKGMRKSDVAIMRGGYSRVNSAEGYLCDVPIEPKGFLSWGQFGSKEFLYHAAYWNATHH